MVLGTMYVGTRIPLVWFLIYIRGSDMIDVCKTNKEFIFKFVFFFTCFFALWYGSVINGIN